MSRSCRRAEELSYAVGVETLAEGADLWNDGRAYRLHVVVGAESVARAVVAWRETYGSGPNICVSCNPAHAEVVRLRRTRLPC